MALRCYLRIEAQEIVDLLKAAGKAPADAVAVAAEVLDFNKVRVLVTTEQGAEIRPGDLHSPLQRSVS